MLEHHRVVVVKRVEQVDGRPRRGDLDGSSPHIRRRVGERGDNLVVGEGLHSCQCSESQLTGDVVGVGEGGAGRGFIAAMTCHRHVGPVWVHRQQRVAGQRPSLCDSVMTM